MNKSLRLFTLIFTCVYFFSSSVVPAWAAMTYTYDANGNMSSDGTKCYEYNDANQIKRVKYCGNNQPIADYVYDYNGNRIVKKQYQNGNLQKTVVSPNDSYEILKPASTSATYNTTYYYANDQLIAKEDPYGNNTFYHNDHLGSSAIMTDENGDLVEETSYDPWGEVKIGGTKSKFQYTGQEKDDETGLNYYGARYYDPHIRRFTQPDSVVQNMYDPQMLNRYSYVRNNPLRYTDPSGHCIGPLMVVCIAGAIAAPSILAAAPAIIGYVSQIYTNVRKDPSPANIAKTGAGVALDLFTGGKGKAVTSTAAKGASYIPEAKAAAQTMADGAKQTSSNFRQNLGKMTGGVKQGYDAHHVFPQKFRSDFESANINIDEAKYGAWWEKSDHRKNAYNYNKAWENYLYKDGEKANMNTSEILDFGNTLMGTYGISTKY